MKLRYVFVLGLFACNAENAVVGGRCLAGFTESGGACVSNAGASSSGSPGNGFADGTPSIPSEETASGSSSGGGAGSPIFDGDAGITTSAITVGTVTVPATLNCSAPLVACKGACIPVASDGDNCGACGKVCPSNICIDGECKGAIAGDVIVLGHEYASSWSSSAQAKMIANAVSIPTTDPIRVLAFDGNHPGAAVERSLIASSVKFRGVSYTAADDASLTAGDLAKRFDVVLVHGAGSDPDALGKSWAGALDTFTKKGGIVLALDDGSSDIPKLLRSASLLSIDDHVALPGGTQVVVTAPNDAVGVQVLSPHAPLGASVGFLGVAMAPDVTIVARTNDEASMPTAVHRFVAGVP